MKSKTLIILSVWSAVTIIFGILMLLGVAYSDNPTQWLIWTYGDWFRQGFLVGYYDLR